MEYFRWLLLSWEGRINRKLYIFSIIGLCAVSMLPILAGILFSFNVSPFWFPFYFLCCIGPVCALSVKRWHDTGRPTSRVWLYLSWVALTILSRLFGFSAEKDLQDLGSGLGALAALLNLWMFIELWLLPGTIGPNQYGPDPLQHEEKNPALSEVDKAIHLIEPWVERRVPFALSMQKQLEWCRLKLSGYAPNDKPAEISLVKLAEKEFDEWNGKNKLLEILGAIEQAVNTSKS